MTTKLSDKQKETALIILKALVRDEDCLHSAGGDGSGPYIRCKKCAGCRARRFLRGLK